jgi:hypothetical protein
MTEHSQELLYVKNPLTPPTASQCLMQTWLIRNRDVANCPYSGKNCSIQADFCHPKLQLNIIADSLLTAETVHFAGERIRYAEFLSRIFNAL